MALRARNIPCLYHQRNFWTQFWNKDVEFSNGIPMRKNGNLLLILSQLLRPVSRFRKHQLDLFRNMKRIYLYGKFLYDRKRFHCCNEKGCNKINCNLKKRTFLQPKAESNISRNK